MKMVGVIVMTMAAMALVSGCDNGGGSSDKGGSSAGSVVGEWAMVNQTDGGQTWWKFNADGTFVQYNDAGFSSQHLAGTFTQDGTTVTGPFTNPGVGTGEIDCTLSSDGKTMQMDFVEFWHDPPKHNPINGTKL